MLLDLGSFNRRRLMVDRECPAKTFGVDKAQKGQRVQDPKGDGGRQRDTTDLSAMTTQRHSQLARRRFQ